MLAFTDRNIWNILNTGSWNDVRTAVKWQRPAFAKQVNSATTTKPVEVVDYYAEIFWFQKTIGKSLKERMTGMLPS
jgi:hypothetical protein